MNSLPSISIVIEFENADRVAWDRVGTTLHALAGQLREVSFRSHLPKVEIICVHAGTSEDSEPLRRQVSTEIKRVEDLADVDCISLPDGRYYELKNAGITAARGELIVLLDSDVIPENDWLAKLLSPFSESTAIAVTGHTFLGYGDLISRTFALMWVFPLRQHDQQALDRRPLVANNSAFRSKWLKDNLFPVNDGFKVSCTLMARRLQDRGHTLIRVPAKVSHAPLTGFRFLVWRALVTGRDADRKVIALKGKKMFTRIARALKNGIKMELRTIRRVLTHYRKVALPLWQVPFAIAIGSSFCALVMVGQVLQAAGLTDPRIERVPDYVESH